MENKSSASAACDEKDSASLSRDEQFKKKLSELDAKLSELAALFSGETVVELKKCPYCAGEKPQDAGACRFCKGELATTGKIQKQETGEMPEKIVYIIRGNKRSDMTWHKISGAAEVRKAAEKKYGYILTIEEVTTRLTRKGWVVSSRDENEITFSGKEKSFNPYMFLLFLCLFIFPAIIYVFGARPSKTVHVTFPLK